MLSKRILALFFAALVVLSSSAFFGGTVYADSLNPTPQSPLTQDDIVLQQQSQVVAQKKGMIDDQNDQIAQLLQKKDALAQQLTDAQQRIADLNQQLTDKKAAAEAAEARLKALQDMFVHINRYAPDSGGNLYAFGNCTWYVKSMRPDASNSWGNANTWYYSAQAQGWNVGSVPKKGAIGTTTRGYLGHVVYVTGVSADASTVYISEMNVAGLNVIDTRSEAASDFQYIYELN